MLMTAFLALPAKDQPATGRFAYRNGTDAGKDDPDPPEPFFSAWIKATDAEHRGFRAELINWKPAAVAA